MSTPIIAAIIVQPSHVFLGTIRFNCCLSSAFQPFQVSQAHPLFALERTLEVVILTTRPLVVEDVGTHVWLLFPIREALSFSIHPMLAFPNLV
ncbi:MAG: hypothetical protein U0236_08230 [Nitrospira sp.]